MEMFIIVAIFYFIPAMIAYHRRHKNAGAITALNLFLGWSLIGWVVAIVWAFTDNTNPKVKK